MARQVCAPQDCKWPVVGVSERHRGRTLWKEIDLFLSDAERPGFWSVAFDYPEFPADGVLAMYQISDERVAFEFRMRFG